MLTSVYKSVFVVSMPCSRPNPVVYIGSADDYHRFSLTPRTKVQESLLLNCSTEQLPTTIISVIICKLFHCLNISYY